MLLPGTWDTSWPSRAWGGGGGRGTGAARPGRRPDCRGGGSASRAGGIRLGPAWLLALWLSVAIVSSQPPTTGGCPRACFCNTISLIVYCSRRGLPYIPEGIPRDSLQLNLNGNVFRTNVIQRANFSEYPDLEHLYLSECGIETIQVETFVDLTKLKWLDLSNNRIRIIEDFTFRGLSLMHLFLNGNRNIEIRPNSFRGLDANGLYLHDCSLKKITVEVLAPLNSTLRYLWLTGNEMERVDKKLLSLFSTLSHLRLGSNPLHCNCEIQWLKEFYDRSEEIFKGAVAPSCLTPARLKGKFFNELEQFDFKCQPPVFNNIDALLDEETGRLRCTASGDPAPTLFWIKPSGESAKYAPPADEDIHQNEGVLAFSSSQTKHNRDLSGMYICLAYNEAGNVTLTLNVSWPKASKSTVVDYQHHPTAPSSGRKSGDDDQAGGSASSASPTRFPSLHDPNRNQGDDGGGGDGGGGGRSGNARNRNKNKHNRNPPPPLDEVDLNEDPSLEEGGDLSPNQNAESDRKKTIKTSNTAANDPTQGKGKSYNFTALNMLDYNRRKGERLFNLTELIGAVIGTHVCTLLLCLIFMPIYLKRQWKRRHHSPHHHTLEKQPPNETLYLNGLGHVHDYMDTPSPKR